MDLLVTPFTFVCMYVHMYICTPASINMNNGIIPVPDEVLKCRSLLFDLTAPITLPAKEFDKRFVSL
jgi:hypothetical protein